MYHIFCVHSSVEGHLCCFQLLSIMNKAAINIVEHVSFIPVGTSSGYMPRRGIAGSSGSTMSNFLRNLQKPSRPSLEKEAHRTHKLYMPQYRGTPGPKKREWGGREVGRRVWGTFGIALEM